MENILKNIDNQTLIYATGTFVLLAILYIITYFTLRKLGSNPKYLIPKDAMKRVSMPLFILFLSLLVRSKSLHTLLYLNDYSFVIRKTSTLMIIFSITWLILVALKVAKKLIIQNYDVKTSDNLKARKIYTQFNILERIFIVVVAVLALGAALMSFDSIREIGLSLFASAGVAGIIIGFSAQKLIGSILAGIQIAITQPIKFDDVVVVEGEWGRIEEITLTYVVIKIWDKRRLIVPTTYFIENPFQNWTKTSADILGTVFIHTDYRVPFDKLREELTRILSSSELWDGNVNVLQVTDAKAQSIEIRALVSAVDSATAWDLRVLVREKLIGFLQEHYPESLPHTRLYLSDDAQPNSFKK
ncbi:mechanosensitive ion channel family protein [Arenibacter sp. ARW7G5Y1]|uniref:mechanosensitive ion channel family protein n=1 Tax=Arenibacter sp. ARW7G5Y1 TaxID=2135619 RepID=UPI000D76084F|nr:mechanosensitive ion channel domain-containing protein [Arenibacter sp. ARW7G5Y1]PXX27709.1 small-conductance mechanosensitive channel [Arenibacter sp. ARW7G5Y1]|tara:strand:+ start:3795 stop:4868 length:1074 start_codon:yes stop_codon:yes gene_type:complete